MTALALAPELNEAAGTTRARVAARPGTPGRREVPSRPVGKPGNCPAPQLAPTGWLEGSTPVRTRSCAVAGERAVSAPDVSQWRLTDRGIAVVLSLAVLLGVAAMVCIGLRAVEVTSADYQASSSVAGVGSPTR